MFSDYKATLFRYDGYRTHFERSKDYKLVPVKLYKTFRNGFLTEMYQNPSKESSVISSGLLYLLSISVHCKTSPVCRYCILGLVTPT